MLKSLVIKNFRGLENLKVDRLGQINLIVGLNNSGKSTVLEAVRILAGNASKQLLEEIARGHDERYRPAEPDTGEDEAILPFEEFFPGRKFPKTDDEKLVIGDETSDENILSIAHVFLKEVQETVVDETESSRVVIRRRPVSRADLPGLTDEVVRQALVVTRGDKSSTMLLDVPRRASPLENSAPTHCSVVPTRFVSMDELARDWDNVAVVAEHAEIVKQALREITPEFENLVFVENTETSVLRRDYPRRELYRIPKVGLSDLPRAVPLNSLGDGILRVLQLVLKVFPAANGYLLIDEFENGLHYSIQEPIWELIFDLALKFKVQVFATTHSWDCIASFSRVAKRREDVNGLLFRVGKSALSSSAGKAVATVFDEDQLYELTQADLEVRG